MQGLIKDLKEHTIKQLYVFYGPENYLIRYYKRSLIAKLIPPGTEMNLHVIEDKADIGTAVDYANTYPFMHDKRLIVFDYINIFKNYEPELAALLNSVPDYCYILILERDIDKRTRAFKEMEKKKAMVEFPFQSSPALKKWIINQLRSLNMEISEEACELLLTMAGEEMDAVYQELQKLIGYCYEKKKIRKEDVQSLGVPVLSNRIFEMMNRGLRGRTSEALRMYKDMLLLKESPTKVLILMNRQYLQLLHIKEMKGAGADIREISERLKLNYYILKKEYYHLVDEFDTDYLQKKVNYGCELEFKLKSGELNEKLAVELLLLYH